MLDDESAVSRIDKSNMLDTLADLPGQIKDALQIIKTANIPDFVKIDNVIVTGMGASGISGDIVNDVFYDKLEAPLFVNKGYTIPKWADKNTLSVFLSYSGNTEETISSLKNALQKKTRIICVSSGGKLKEISDKAGLPFIQIPGGFQPRAAVAYLLFPLIYILRQNHVIRNTVDNDVDETLTITSQYCTQFSKKTPESENPPKQIARLIHGTTPQLYGWGIYSSTAKRWRTQINENSKMIARDDVVSECNHNDIVGWAGDPDSSKRWSCVIIRDKTEESVYISARLDFMRKLFEGSVARIIEVQPRGKSRLAKVIYLISLGDFMSCYLAILRGVDPSPVDVITTLKTHLATI